MRQIVNTMTHFINSLQFSKMESTEPYEEDEIFEIEIRNFLAQEIDESISKIQVENLFEKIVSSINS